MRDRHRDAMLELAERIAPELHGPGQQEWLGVLDDEAANLAAALEHAARTDRERALRLCVALTFWWRRAACSRAGRARLRASAGSRRSDALAAARAGALGPRLPCCCTPDGTTRRSPSLQQAQDVAEAVGDQSALARALMAVGSIQMFRDPVGSRPVNERACELARACGDDWTLIISTINLATVHSFRCEFDEAERLVDETLPLSQTHGYLRAAGMVLVSTLRSGHGSRPTAPLPRRPHRTRARVRASGRRAHHRGVRTRPLARISSSPSGDADAALARMRAAHARALAAGAGLALGWAVSWLALAQAAARRAR